MNENSGMGFEATLELGNSKLYNPSCFYQINIFFFFRPGNSSTGEQQLVVTMELNGVQYEGVLFANPATLANASAAVAAAVTTPAPSISQETLTTTANHSSSSIDDRTNHVVARPLVSS